MFVGDSLRNKYLARKSCLFLIMQSLFQFSLVSDADRANNMHRHKMKTRHLMLLNIGLKRTVEIAGMYGRENANNDQNHDGKIQKLW